MTTPQVPVKTTKLFSGVAVRTKKTPYQK